MCIVDYMKANSLVSLQYNIFGQHRWFIVHMVLVLDLNWSGTKFRSWGMIEIQKIILRIGFAIDGKINHVKGFSIVCL